MPPLIIPRVPSALPRTTPAISEEELYALGTPWPWRLIAWMRGRFAAPVISDRAACPSRYPASR